MSSQAQDTSAPIYAPESTAVVGLLHDENKRLRKALETIANYGDEENEWDAVERYDQVRTLAMNALGLLP